MSPRCKDVEDDAIRRAARVLKPIAQDRGVAFIMNDRPDLAAEPNCDGMHVGEEDMPYGEARRLLGPDRIVGVTCGASCERALVVAEAGADCVVFGAFFPSPTKGGTKYRADPVLLRDGSETTIVPCCAIGGMPRSTRSSAPSTIEPVLPGPCAREGFTQGRFSDGSELAASRRKRVER